MIFSHSSVCLLTKEVRDKALCINRKFFEMAKTRISQDIIAHTDIPGKFSDTGASKPTKLSFPGSL